MAARKQSSKKSSKSASSSKSAKKRAGSGRAAAKGGPVPPYGVAIKEAVARGDAAGMRKAAAGARKWLKDVQAALARLEKAIEKEGGG
jgi:Domain of unknown function (DUF1843)